MKILRVHPFLKSERFYASAGGMARTSLRLSQELARLGHELRVYPIPEMFGTSTLWDLGGGMLIPVEPTMRWPSWRAWPRILWKTTRLRPPPQGLRSRVSDAMALRALEEAIHSFRPDVIHNHLARLPFPRLYEALRPRVPLLLTHHHGEPGEGLDRYPCVVFVSRAQESDILSRVGIPAERVRVIHNPVDPAFLAVQLRPAGERSGVLFAGALRDRKGVDLILEAYSIERRLARHALTLYGDGPDRGTYEQLARDRGLNVRFAGKVAPDALARALSQAELLVHPSRLEGWSASINEALCCGTPVVGWAPQVQELEFLLGNPVGLPFDGRTQGARELADLMLHALDARAELDLGRMAASAREAFGAAKFVRRYLALYQELVGGPREEE